jgi:transcriptional regulator
LHGLVDDGENLARANPQWRGVADGAPALAVVTGPDAYVSPAWYPSKDEHGRVVPTWNYSQVHLSGRLTVHHDPVWLLAISLPCRPHSAPIFS